MFLFAQSTTKFQGNKFQNYGTNCEFFNFIIIYIYRTHITKILVCTSEVHIQTQRCLPLLSKSIKSHSKLKDFKF